MIGNFPPQPYPLECSLDDRPLYDIGGLLKLRGGDQP